MRQIATPSTETKERATPKASANANGTGFRAVRGSTSGGADADASCRITRRVGDEEAIRESGYSYAVRIQVRRAGNRAGIILCAYLIAPS